MGWIVLFVVLLISAVLGLGVVPLFIGKHDPGGRGNTYDINANGRLISRGVGAAFLALFLLFFVFGGVNEVPVKNVGVVTSFGHVEGELQPGIHWLLPWKNVTDLSETVQTTEYQASGVSPTGACVNSTRLPTMSVRIGGQQLACLNLTIQWQLRDSAAPQLFNLYDTSGNVQGEITDAVVQQELESVTNQVMGDYNPIQDVSESATAGNSQFSTFGPMIKSQMVADIGSQIEIRKLILKNAVYDSATQSRLNAVQQQYADTAIAQEQILTNQAQAKANQALANSISNDPGVLVADCQNITLTAIKDGYALPAGWNCGTANSLALAIGSK
jgi:regulator of protease activity HflC (stomatin/prohibitin superfamily)